MSFFKIFFQCKDEDEQLFDFVLNFDFLLLVKYGFVQEFLWIMCDLLDDRKKNCKNNHEYHQLIISSIILLYLLFGCIVGNGIYWVANWLLKKLLFGEIYNFLFDVVWNNFQFVAVKFCIISIIISFVSFTYFLKQ